MDAGGTVTAEGRLLMHKECNTLIEASDSVAVRKLVVHAGHAEETELKQASWTEECGSSLGEIPSYSWLLQP